MISNATGMVHLVASVIALITGTMVLIGTKATKKHQKIGYVYSLSMLVLLATSFMIYRLHGTFGVLHVFSVISGATLLAGMLPMFVKRPKDYLQYHFSFMYWSVIGLYCAFAAEIFTRIPILFELGKDITVTFYALVGLSAAAVGGVGSIYFRKYKDSWKALYQNN
ncbi:hypothetical protein FK220_008580 [Flavobacteriaceae bacterium TP-CH-4]|uniref:DUF2306 domain-containing protein n=1 Tax=Pelagihabitans pacificus TaxID=2696054 RepID=A0A967AT00_9FLAO|nr:hypothetical protein [Pelagihabitans pacificus]NHF59392.1 hypothetical protein [Pelagihabitans pacificus]